MKKNEVNFDALPREEQEKIEALTRKEQKIIMQMFKGYRDMMERMPVERKIKKKG